MRPRPTSATNRQLLAVTMFLVTGCIWWRTAPIIKEEISYARTLLGLSDRSEQTFSAQFHDAEGALPKVAILQSIGPPATPALPPAHRQQIARFSGRQ